MTDNFPEFSQIVNRSYQKLVKSDTAFEVELVGEAKDEKGENIVVINGDALYVTYLAAFPPGTNPVFKNRTEHECSCCRQFIRRAGLVVGVNYDASGAAYLKTIWDEAVEAAPHPYNVVAEHLRAVVMAAPIANLYRVGKSEVSFGAQQSHSMSEAGKALTWNHFYSGAVPAAVRHDNPDTVKGEWRTSAQVFERGLKELSPEAVDTVLSLIEANNLYRGEEFKTSILDFKKAQSEYASRGERGRHLYTWAHAHSPASRIRNTAIGTLLQDLSEGKDVDHAVSSFEAKVAPQNYKRPTAVITPGMIKKAMETLQELGLESALERRYAKLSDISVNDVKWVDTGVQSLMKGGIGDLLMQHAAVNLDAEVEAKRAEDIGLEIFMKDILPTVTRMDLLLRSSHLGNLMSLTAPIHPEPKQLFKWKNDFAWSYIGSATDSELRKAVQSRGGRVDGVFRFSHSWNYDKRNASLMDLHVFMPGSDIHGKALNCNNDYYGNDERVGWNHRSHSKSGGVQDVDYTAPAPVGYVPVENTTFPDLRRMPEGRYLCKVHNWNLRSPTEGGFRAEIEFGGTVYAYEYVKPLKNKEWVAVATVTLKSGSFSIEHHLPCGATPQEKWGLKTEQYVKVNAVTLSPNYWGDNALGNKHTFFMLDGAKNDEPTRGIYNEFLHPRLEPHRKVFEVIGDKTKCQPTEGQLSGVGFSSTKHESVIVKVSQGKKQRLFKLNVGA